MSQVTSAPLARTQVHALVAAMALTAAMALGTCASPSDNGVGGTGAVDNTFSDVSVGGIAGAGANGDQSTGIGMLEPRGSLNWSERLAGLVAIERVANAATFSCASKGTFASGGASTIVYTPATNCTVTYPATGVTGTYDVTGSWTLTFSAACTSPAPGGAVSNNPAGCVVTRSATSGSVTQNYTGPFGDTYVVSENTGTCTPWTGSVSCGGFQTTCESPGCPFVLRPNGVRSVDILGAQVAGTKNGIVQYNHTIVSGPGAPIVITGLGPNRVISSGTVVVYHNLAHVTTTTTIHGPLTHEAGCAYPVSGSVSTAISGGADNGLTETVTFSGNCGSATVLNPVGKKFGLNLHLSL